MKSKEFLSKITFLFLAICFLSGGCLVLQKIEVQAAQHGEAVENIYDENGFYFCVYSDGAVSVIYYSGNATELTLPASVKGKKVTDIDLFGGFPNGDKITSVTIPSGVKVIEELCFAGCTNLRKVILPNSLEEIKYGAFSDCIALTDIRIPDSVTNLENNVFSGCVSLDTINIPASISVIDRGQFYQMMFKKIVIPGTVKHIGEKAFYDCERLTDVVIQDGVLTIGDEAFAECPALKRITIPNSVNSIGEYILTRSPAALVCNEESYAYRYAVQAGYIKKQSQGNSSELQNPCVNVGSFTAGQKRKVSGGIYVGLGNGKVAYAAPISKKVTSATVLNTVRVGEKTYKVTQINGKAFAGCSRLKKIIIKAQSLKKVGSKAFRGIHKKAIIKVPKTKLKTYKTLLKGKGQAKSVKIVK